MWRPSAICSGAGARTATAHVETPRIITPSSTACPPSAASREATSGGAVGASSGRSGSCRAAVMGW